MCTEALGTGVKCEPHPVQDYGGELWTEEGIPQLSTLGRLARVYVVPTNVRRV